MITFTNVTFFPQTTRKINRVLRKLGFGPVKVFSRRFCHYSGSYTPKGHWFRNDKLQKRSGRIDTDPRVSANRSNKIISHEIGHHIIRELAPTLRKQVPQPNYKSKNYTLYPEELAATIVGIMFDIVYTVLEVKNNATK